MPCSVLGSLINPGPFVSLASFMEIGLASGLAPYADIGYFHTYMDIGLAIGLASGLAPYADIGHFFTNFDSDLDT